MSISRRDTILMAVFINTAFLAILFLTATHYEEDLFPKPPPAVKKKALVEKAVAKAVPPPVAKAKSSEGTLVDEVDNVLRAYASNFQKKKVEETPVVADASPEFVGVTVKRGDALSKIAKANGISEKELKRINHLSSDRIDVGQLLKVPVAGTATAQEVAMAPEEFVKKEEAPVAISEPIYYTMKSGDNPWNIARKNNVRFEELLRLNGLNEERARNLQIGDRVRVR